jgi:hypothetical protein
MKRSIMAVVLTPLLLAACAQADQLVFHGAFGEARGRASNARQYEADLKVCDHQPGAEWCRIAADDGNLARAFPLDLKPLPKGLAYVYDASQCVGNIEHGLCRGTVMPRVSVTPVCHGQTIDGVCAGPIF